MKKTYITNYDDTIFATAIYLGKEVRSLRLSGVTSLSELFALIRKELTDVCGFVTIKLRNWSQGWSLSHIMRLTPPEGLQLSLF